MRSILFLVVMVLSGCATVHKSLEDGTTVTYNGTAAGAAKMLDASNERPYDLAETAMDNGLPTNLQTRDVRFSAGYGVQGYGTMASPGGYAPGTVTSVPGQGIVSTGQVSGLPRLATTTVVTSTSVPHSTSISVIECPQGRDPQTAEELAVCVDERVDGLYSDMKILHTKPK